MKRFAALTGMAALLMALGLAFADTSEPHRHVLLQGVEVVIVDGEYQLVGFRKCVDLAGGRALRNNAHHDNAHTGTAGEKLFTRAGHAVIPFASCAALEAFFSDPS